MVDAVDGFQERQALRAWEDGHSLSEEHRFTLARRISQLRTVLEADTSPALADALEALLNAADGQEALDEAHAAALRKRLGQRG